MRDKHYRKTTVEEHSDGASIVTHQDVGPILKNNKELLNNYGDKRTFW